jgi:hypothetical protein
LFASEYGKRFRHHCTFNAATTDGTNNFAVFIHRHCGAGIARSRALNVYNASESDALSGCFPPVNVVE